ncbi:pilus assembly FimT family protein [Loktanella sp. Alg231-35]|uniref:pilus assembly FimT family protein n=1 Tax=Loktanella sp. Alg231-35 TaxID=1922220 RepID=UPI00131F0F88|nr:hypothetical protein [Loktanella sp. Alg231-35]
MWKARRPTQWRNAQGFAAVEMLVTVAIVVLIGTISIFALGRTEKAQLENDVASIALMFQQARLQAAETGRPVEVIYSQPDMRVSTPIETHVFGRGVTSPTESATIAIRPSGESEGLELVLVSGDLTRTVGVDWLTGQVRLSP